MADLTNKLNLLQDQVKENMQRAQKRDKMCSENNELLKQIVSMLEDRTTGDISRADDHAQPLPMPAETLE